MNSKVSAILALAASTLVVAAPAQAKSSFVVFGDSLSDNGNTGRLLNSNEYWNGRFTNSYVWSEYTADILEMNLANYAYGSASSSNTFSPSTENGTVIPSLSDQVSLYLSANPNPSKEALGSSIISVLIGSNDIATHLPAIIGFKENFLTFSSTLGKQVAKGIQPLVDAGYKNIFVWNMPPIDRTPQVIESGFQLVMKPAVSWVNLQLKRALKSMDSTNVRILDLHKLVSTAMDQRFAATVNVTNISTECYRRNGTSMGPLSVCGDADSHFFYDNKHPASRVHYTWGVMAAAMVRNPDLPINVDKMLELTNKYEIGKSSSVRNILVD
ncbi:hypothetical protein FBU59_002148 [Linderina macrospora]|uniref:Uncharacterized protein n=1 Tax=Linderina macrospora TaxID=4868 RepID=A0ACC1JBU0_9FUNG|nr:hypothetical protein FBU59_002148 [Linderina macrospora]